MSLTERFHTNKELSVFHGQIPVNYKYTYGVAGENFFRALKDKGKLTASRCEKCGVTYLPARIFCERCLGPLAKPFDVPHKGVVQTFTVCYKNMDGSDKDTPDILAAIKIDGTDCALVHYLGVTPDEAFIGMRVEAVLKPAAKRQGSIFDILHFKPVEK